jgi:hypothetical protein
VQNLATFGVGTNIKSILLTLGILESRVQHVRVHVLVCTVPCTVTWWVVVWHWFGTQFEVREDTKRHLHPISIEERQLSLVE